MSTGYRGPNRWAPLPRRVPETTTARLNTKATLLGRCFMTPHLSFIEAGEACLRAEQADALSEPWSSLGWNGWNRPIIRPSDPGSSRGDASGCSDVTEADRYGRWEQLFGRWVRNFVLGKCIEGFGSGRRTGVRWRGHPMVDHKLGRRTQWVVERRRSVSRPSLSNLRRRRRSSLAA